MNNDHSPEPILQKALEISDLKERAAWLDEACGDDEALRQVVESLLAAHFAAEAFLDTVPAEFGRKETKVVKEGDSIGRYKLLQEIGEGGFGTVYMAEQTEPVKRRVALKVIKPGMDSKEIVARFEAERQALALMDHPNIAKVHDAGTTEGGRPYFVMELVKGVPLTKYCAAQDLDTKERLDLFTDVCAAVQHAHHKGIIHRDLKPSNILVSPHDGKPVVKVIDFGIAKAISMELTEKTFFTQLGRMIGTPQYMSPEQAELNAIDVDTRSDIYSLGVVLYELLTGTTPLDGEKLRSAAYGEMQRLIREETPAKPSTRVSTVGRAGSSSHTANRRRLQGDLDWIAMKALEKERTRRYETANALAQDIARHLRDEPVEAGPPSVGYRMNKFVRRNRRGLLSGAAAAVALLLGLAVAGGVWLDATLKDSRRLAEVEGNATTLIEQAERLMEQNAAADYDDDSHFRQVLNLVKQLENLVGLEEAGEEVRTRRDQIIARVNSEERDRDLILGIEKSLMMEIGAGSYGSPAEVEKGIAEAFGKHDSDPLVQPLAETAAWLEPRREGVRGRILAGMLLWAGLLTDKTPDDAGKLISVVASIDPDPWRQQLRLAIEEEDRPALEQLASEEEVDRQQIMTVLSLARALLEVDSRVKAEELLRQAQREHPESFWLNYNLGVILGAFFESHSSASREDGFSTILSTQYYQPNREFKRRPEFDESAGFLRTAVAIRPDAAEGWNRLGVSLVSGGRVEEAIASFQRAIEHQPDMAGAYANLGAMHMQGELGEAIRLFRKAIELDPELAMAHNNLGATLREQGKLDEAIGSFHKAIELDPAFALAHANLGIVLKVQGKLDEAITSFHTAIKLAPAKAEIYSDLGSAFHDQGELDKAIASYHKAIELEPDFAETYYNLGIALHDQRELDKAIASYRQAIELEPDFAAAHSSLGNAFLDQGNLDQAVDSHRQAIELDPDCAVAHNNLGNALRNQGKLDQAIASFLEAIELDPALAGAHTNLGIVLKVQGRLDKAIESYQKAIHLDPDCVLAYYNLGNAFVDLRKPVEAIASYQETIKLDPDFAMAHIGLSQALCTQGELDKAIDSCRRAIELAPDIAIAHNNLGFALHYQGKLIEAEKPLRETLRLNPDPQLQAYLEFMLTSDRKLLGILRKDGVGHPSVSVLVQQLSGAIPFPGTPQGLVRKFWEDHPEQVLGELEQREVTMVMVPKGDGAKVIAEKIRDELGKGETVAAVKLQFDGKATFANPQTELRGGFHPPLQEMIFATPVGGMGEIITFRDWLWVMKVHAAIPGKAENFDDPGVEEAAKSAFERRRREQWEKDYLERLQKRIAEDDARKAEGQPDGR